MLETRHIDVFDSDRKRVHILKDVSLTIGQGEFVVILGRSGSGKSTLLNVLGGIERPQGGQVLFQDEPIYTSRRTAQKYVYEHVGFVFQDYNLIDSLTAAENIELAMRVRRRRRDRDDLSGYLDLFEVAHVADKLPYEMSGGEQQRVSIIRTLVLDPDILLCDEPTGALDSTSAEKVTAQLQAINASFGKTIIMVTHDESYAEMAQRVVRIHDGRVVASDPVCRVGGDTP